MVSTQFEFLFQGKHCGVFHCLYLIGFFSKFFCIGLRYKKYIFFYLLNASFANTLKIRNVITVRVIAIDIGNFAHAKKSYCSTK